jgi:hypothetical protein
MTVEEMAMDDWEWYHVTSETIVDGLEEREVTRLIMKAYIEGYKTGITRLITDVNI